MANYNFCPNLSLPENRERIKEVGKAQFMKEYYEENFNIDSSFANREAIDELFINMDDFSYRMQSEILDSILYSLDGEIKQGVNNSNEAFNNVKESFEGQLYEFKQDNDDGSLDKYIEVFYNILGNWDKFKEFAIRDLNKIGIKLGRTIENTKIVSSNKLSTVNDNELTNDSHFTETESNYRRDNYSDSFAFSKSTKDNASGRLKYTLSRIPKVEVVNGSVESATNFLGLPSYMELDKVWGALLVETAPFLEDQIFDALKVKAEFNPMIAEVVNLLESDDSGTLLNEFIVTFSNQQANHTTVTFRLNDEGEVDRTRVFDTNRNNADSIILNQWAQNIKDTKFVKEVDGNYVIDTSYSEKLNPLVEYLVDSNNKSKPKYKQSLEQLLGNLGITLSPAALEFAVSKGFINYKGGLIPVDTFVNTNLRVVLKRLKGDYAKDEANLTEEGDITLDNNNPFISESTSLLNIARTELAFNPFMYESSFINGEGNSKYTYIKNSYLSKTFKELKSDTDEFLRKYNNSSYSKHGFWNQMLANEPSFLANFRLSYLDTIRVEGKASDSGTQFKDMNNREKELTRLLLFNNQGRNNNGLGVFIPMIPSDKSTIPLVQADKVNVEIRPNNAFNRDTNKALFDIFLSEYSRIKDVFDEQSRLPETDLIDGYHKGQGEKFVIYDFFNGDSNIFNEDGTIKDLSKEDLREFVMPKIVDFASNLINSQIEAWDNLELDPSILADSNYRKNIREAMPKIDPKLAIAADYTINNFIASVSYTQLFSGDPAILGKRSLEATWVNYFKRAAKEIAPGMDGNWKSTTYRTLVVNDPTVDSNHLKEYSEAIGSRVSAYKGMELADAQEYVTLQEALDTLEAFGKISPEVIEAGSRLLKEGSELADIQTVLEAMNNIAIGPTKPVQVGVVNNGNVNANRMWYIKSSAFPLIPALTKGLEIDKLRRFMEDAVDENGISRPIQRVTFKTAVKIGSPLSIQNAFNDNGTFNTNLKDESVVLDRSIFRIQQEVPSDLDATTSNEGSQAKKLVLGDLANDDLIQIFGEQVEAGTIRERFNNLHSEKTKRGFQEFLRDFGISEDLTITDMSKFQKALLKEAVERNFGINDLYGLQLKKDPITGVEEFIIPLGFQNNSSKIESLINSLVTNRAIKQELPGFSSVQGSSVGFRRVTEGTEDLLKNSGIVWVGTPGKQLNYIRKSTNGKELVQADIIVPSWFRGSDGKLLDLTKFVDKDGFLDIDRIPKEALDLFGIRIPTQGYNSMMIFRVKGFLPNYMGSLAIVPAEVVAQMGSDFDVDKMFFYRREYSINKDNSKVNIIKYPNKKDISEYSDSQLNNAIFDIYFERLKDPTLLPKILEPNGFGRLIELSETIGKELGLTLTGGHALSAVNQNSVHEANSAGKAGIGIFSLFSVFTKFAQESELSFNNKSIKVTRDSNSSSKSLSIIADPKLEVSPTMVIQYFQSAAVDNANEQILGNLNINSHNMDIVGVMAILGVDEETIAYFTSHPTVREITRRLDIVGDTLDTGFENNPFRKVFVDMYKGENAFDIYTELNTPSNQYEIELNISKLKDDLLNGSIEDYSILMNFALLKSMAANIRPLMSLAGLDTKGVGQRYADIESTLITAYNLLEQSSKEPSITNVERFIASGIVRDSLTAMKDLTSIYSQLFPYTSKTYSSIIEGILSASGKSNSIVSSRQISKMYDFSRAFIFNESLASEDIIGERIDLLFNFKGNLSLGNRFKEYFKTSKGSKRLLKDRLIISSGKEVSSPVILGAINNPSASNIDNNNVIADIYDMYYNGTEVEKDLISDLVKYYIYTGGQMSPSSLGKFIPFDILEESEFSKHLREINTSLKPFVGNPYKKSLNIVNQYFQANPSEAFPIDLTDVGVSVSKDGSIYISNQNLKYQVDKKKNGNSYKGFPDYISSYNKDTKVYDLYKLSDFTSSGTGIFFKVPTIKNKDLLEIDPSRLIAGSLIKKQQAPERVSSPISEIPVNSIKIKDGTSTIPNKPESKNTEELDKWTQDIKDRIIISPMSFIEYMMEQNIPSELVSVLTDLRSSISNLEDFKIEDFNHPFALGAQVGNTIYLDIDKFSQRPDRITDMAETLAHELIHVATVDKLISNPSSIYVKNITRLYNRYAREQGEGLNTFKAINQKVLNKEDLTEGESEFYRSNYNKYYPLVDVKEFVAAGLTNPEFREVLKSNNYWVNLWNSIMELLGLNKDLSSDYNALYSATIQLDNESFNPLDVNNEALNITNNTDITDAPFNIDAYEFGLRQEFANQREEFLKTHHKKIGDKLSQNTLNKLKESVRSNPKYNLIELSLWHGELRVSRKTETYPNYNVDSETIKSKILSPEQKAVQATIDRLKNILNKFKSSGQEKVNPVIEQKINSLREEIKKVEKEQSIFNIMEDATVKMNYIQDVLDTLLGTLDPIHIEEFNRYLGFYKDLKKIITFDDSFKEETKMLDDIVSRANSLLENLKKVKLDTAVSYLNSTLDIEVDPKDILTTPIKDTGVLESTFQSGSVSSSKQVQLVAAVIEAAQVSSMMEYNNFKDMAKGVIEAYVKKYGGDYSQFLQRDSEGNFTGHLVSEFSDSYYAELRALKGKNTLIRKFLKDNTTVKISAENEKEFKKDLEDVKKANPLWEVKDTMDYNNMNAFLFYNNPHLYISNSSKGKPTAHMKGALKYITRTPLDKHKDPAYTALMSKPDSDPAKGLFSLLEAEFAAMAKRHGNQSNFIPEFQRDFIDQLLKGDMKGAFGNMSEEVIGSVYKTLEPNVKKSQLDLDGNPFNVIPVMHMNDTLNPKDKEFNLGKVLLRAKQEEIMNKHKIKIEPVLNIMKELIQDLPQYNINSQSGELNVDEDGNPILNYSPTRNKNVNQQVGYMLDDFLYGKGSENSGAVKSKTRTIKTLNSKGKIVETVQVLTLSGVGDTLNQVTRAKGMMLNAFSALANWLWGITSNAMLASNRTYFNESQMLRSLGFVLSSSKLSSKNNKKFKTLFDKFHVLKSKSDISFGRLGVKVDKNPFTDKDLYFMTENGEIFVQGQTVMAILMNKTIKDLKGNTHSLFDAHDEIGNWKTEEFGEDPFLNPKTRMKLVSEISNAIGDAHGDYDRSLQIKKNVLGRMLMVFRTWIPQSLALRFGKEYEDLQGDIRKGRYRSLQTKHLLIAPLVMDIYKAYQTNKEMDDVDTRNLRAIGMEAMFASSLYLLGMILKGMMGDMDDEDKELFYVALNSTVRLRGDLTFYFNPYSFESTIREPAPAFKTIMDFIDLGPAVQDWIIGEDEYKSGVRAGRSRLYHNLAKQFPVINQPAKIENVISMALE